MKLLTYRLNGAEAVGALSGDGKSVLPLPYPDMNTLIETASLSDLRSAIDVEDLGIRHIRDARLFDGGYHVARLHVVAHHDCEVALDGRIFGEFLETGARGAEFGKNVEVELCCIQSDVRAVFRGDVGMDLARTAYDAAFDLDVRSPSGMQEREGGTRISGLDAQGTEEPVQHAFQCEIVGIGAVHPDDKFFLLFG